MADRVIPIDEARERAYARLDWPDLKRGDEAELASCLVQRRKKAGPIVYADGIYREYDEPAGVWVAIDEAVLSREVQALSGAPIGDKRKALRVSAGTVRGTIQLAHDLVSDPNFFQAAPAGVAFENGFVHVDDGKITLAKHAPENRARCFVPFPYDAVAPRDELDTFFEQVFADAGKDERAARIMCLQEFAGACLVGEATRYQRCAIEIGPGGNGKSQAEEIIRAPFPAGTVVSLPPQQWGERFQIAKLVGALANVVDEIPEKEIVSGEVFKSVITGEPVHMERKHRDPFECRPRAGHIFSANTMPGTADLSHGFFRRFIIIRFDRDMENTPGSRKDAAKEVIRANLRGIAAWAIEGAARLQRQGHYTVPDSSSAAVAEWKRTSDSVALFADERTRPADATRTIAAGNGTQASHLYGAYREWSFKSGYRTVSAKTFAQRMEALNRAAVRQGDANYYPVVLLQEAP